MTPPSLPGAASEAAPSSPNAAAGRGGHRGSVPGFTALDEDGWVTARPPGAAQVLRRFLGFPSVLLRNLDLVRTSTRRMIEAQFTGSVLGWFWPLFTPIALFFVYYFIFTKLLGFKLGVMGLDAEAATAMGIYMFTGIVVWSGFAEAVGRCTGTIVENGDVIKKLSFPTELLPLNIVLSSSVTMLFGVAAFLIAVVVANLFAGADQTFILWHTPSWEVLWILAVLPLQLLFTYGLGLFLGTLQVFLRDTAQFMGVFTTLWMFLTPVFWIPSDKLVEGIEEIVPWMKLNPMWHCVYIWRTALMTPSKLTGSAEGFPSIQEVVFSDSIEGAVLTFAIWAVGAFIVGYGLFCLAQRRFADEI
jgi:lipopolysaccharide transport system permease protein